MRRLFNKIKYGFASLPASYYQYSAMSFIFWAAMTGTSFSTVFLRELGFSAMQIGSMTSAFTIINIVAPPLWGILSDKLRSIKKVFAICLSASIVAWLLLPFSVKWFSPLIVLLVLPLYRFVSSPMMTLQDGWIVQHVNRDRRFGFGSIRMWGSIGWTIVAFAYGIVLRTAPLDLIFYGYALFGIPCVIVALQIRENEGPAAGGGDGEPPRRTLSLKEMQLGRIARTKPLMAFLFFALALYTPIQAAFTFMPYLVDATGGHSSFIGLISGAEALLEIPLLFFSSRLIKRFKTTNLILLSACLYVAESVLYGFCQAPWQILLVKCMHGLGYGLYLSCTVQYVYQLAPKGLVSTAQTLVGGSNAIAGIFGNFIGGAVIHTLGVRAFFQISGAYMSLVVAAYTLWLRKNQETPKGINGDGEPQYE